MARRKNLKGLPHNLIKSYFGTLRYYDKGYMADWLLQTARKLNIGKVTLDVLNSSIEPKAMEITPLIYHLKDLKQIVTKELFNNGFDNEFITDAKIIVEIPDKNLYARTIYCYGELVDKQGHRYDSGRIIETAWEFNAHEQSSNQKSLWLKLKQKVQSFFNQNR